MYEEHFGLSKNPFQSIAEGDGVFEGSAQTKVIADLKIALTTRDSIAVITGPVGVGKTTIVQRAMEKMGSERLVAILGRTQVGSDELVDLLLAQFGVVREPTKRFECLKTFNRILNDRAEAGERVFIVIEDAERLGAELLEELEALTASDGGACAGANIILMGPQKLDKLITKPSLERVRQRIRLQQTLERFTAEECEAYLRHRIKAAGGDFDAMFEADASLMVRRCSGGIPRVINSLCETALTMAAENKVSQVSGKIVFKVAVEVFGMSPGDAPASQAPRTTPGPTAPAAKPPSPAAKPTAPAPQKAAPAKAAAPAAQKAADKTPAPAPQPATAVKAPTPAAKKPAPVTHEPASVAASRTPPAEEVAESTIRVPKLETVMEPATEAPQASPPRAPKPPSNIRAPAAKPAATNGAAGPAVKPNADASRLPDLPGLGVETKAPAAEAAKSAAKAAPSAAKTAQSAAKAAQPAASKPLPELPPKFKFADEIVVDRDTKPKLPVPGAKTADLPELATLELDGSKPKPADDIPTLGDSARVEKVAPEVKKVEEKPAAKPALPTPASPASAPSMEEPSPPAARSQPDDDPTASFAMVDHDMLDAALADLAVHDEQDKPNSVEAEMIAAADEPAAAPAPTADPTPESVPEVTLDKSIEAKQAEAKAATDPEELNRMAAELEKTQSLEEMSDQLAETLFGSEELEAISLQIREEAAPEEENPVALEPADVASAASPVATPTAAKAAPAPAAAPPAAPKPPPAPKPAAAAVKDSGPAAVAGAPPANSGPQPEPIENQFNTSMTATLKTLNNHSKAPDGEDADEDEDGSGGLFGRLKNTFKS
jgi:type II secretory pathway predicted ATPase ExeA